jgi:hypothetical protein
VARREPGADLALVAGQDARHAPVEHRHAAAVADHHVGRLEIAVHHAAGVRVLDREADVDERLEQAGARPRRHRAVVALGLPAQHLGQRHADQLAHREVGPAVALDRDVVHRHHRRVIEPALDARLAHEARHRVGGGLTGEPLDGDAAPDATVLRVGDDAHAAAPDLALQRVTPCDRSIVQLGVPRGDLLR